MIADRLPDLLRAELNERGWTAYKLAKETGLPTSTISRLFATGSPSIDTLELILKVLGKDWRWLEEPLK